MRNRLIQPSVGFYFAACCALAQTYTIGTFAGGGLPENNAASTAGLGTVASVAVDPGGNAFIALPDYHIVVKLDISTGTLTRVAGTGTAGFSGDNGSAVNAQLSSPSGLAVDSAGDLYIADVVDNVIRKVSNGIITTVAGNGTLGFFGDSGPATSAKLAQPHGIAVDADFNLYIADTGNLRIRKVSRGIITTFAGDGQPFPLLDGGPATSAHLFLPFGVAVAGSGNVYIADTSHSCVRLVSGGVITTIAGAGSIAPTGRLNLPQGLSIDSGGNLYIADYSGHQIWKFSNGAITPVAGSGTAGFSGDGGLAAAAGLNGPTAVAVDARGNIYIADSKNMRLRVVSSGIIITAAGRGAGGFGGDGGPPADAQLFTPSGVAMDSSGDLYVADTGNHSIRKVSNGVITTIAGTGMTGFSGDGAAATDAQLNGPLSVVVDAGGQLYIADSGNYAVRKLVGGVITTITSFVSQAAGSPPETPTALAVDDAGNLYIATHHEEQRSSFGGVHLTVAVGHIYEIENGAIRRIDRSSFGYIGGLAVDSSGDLLIADGTGSAIWKQRDGVATILAGGGRPGFSGDNGPATNAQLSSPFGIAVDASGAIWIVDAANQRIRRISNGVITTVAGTGPPGLPGLPSFGGDGGSALSAQVNNPQGIVVGRSGQAFFADTGNNRVRVLIPSVGCPSTVHISSNQVAGSGGNLTVSIQTDTSCSWTISGFPPWINPAGVASGTGSATLMLVVSPNPGPQRTTTFVIATQNVTITQTAGTYTVSGRVTLNGQPLAGVLITLGGQFASTSPDGNYSLKFSAVAGFVGLSASLTSYNFLPASASILGLQDSVVNFTAWVQPRITSITPLFVSAVQPTSKHFAPREIISIRGEQLCLTEQSASPPLPAMLGGCIVSVNGLRLALYSSAPDQITAVLPQDAGIVELSVSRYTDSTGTQLAAQNKVYITLGPSSMAFVERSDGGNTLLAAQYVDGGFAGSNRPLTPGDTISFYLAGLGLTVQPQILVEGLPAQILYAGVQPQYPGLDQIVLRLPEYRLSAGKYTATFEITAPSVGQTIRYEINSR